MNTRQGFLKAIETAINTHSMENGSNTPDFILASYLVGCLGAFEEAVAHREAWYGRGPEGVVTIPTHSVSVTTGANHSWFSQAALDVTAERRRQVEEEGWTPEHDDIEHAFGELAQAGSCYAFRAAYQIKGIAPGTLPPAWPFADAWWKPKDPRRNLVKAAALILAAIEQIDRQAPKSQGL